MLHTCFFLMGATRFVHVWLVIVDLLISARLCVLSAQCGDWSPRELDICVARFQYKCALACIHDWLEEMFSLRKNGSLSSVFSTENQPRSKSRNPPVRGIPLECCELKYSSPKLEVYRRRKKIPSACSRPPLYGTIIPHERDPDSKQKLFGFTDVFFSKM